MLLVPGGRLEYLRFHITGEKEDRARLVERYAVLVSVGGVTLVNVPLSDLQRSERTRRNTTTLTHYFTDADQPKEGKPRGHLKAELRTDSGRRWVLDKPLTVAAELRQEVKQPYVQKGYIWP